MLRILAVDDEAVHLMNLIGVMQMLKPGYIIFSAKDGVQALEMMKSFQVDLLITDIRMPNMDGLTLIREAKKLYPELYTVILSGFGEFEYAKKAIELGVDGYLLKTLEQEELLRIMEELENRLLHRQALLSSEEWLQDRLEREAEDYILGHVRRPNPELVRRMVGDADSGVVLRAWNHEMAGEEMRTLAWKEHFEDFLSEWGVTYTFRCRHQEGAMVTVLQCAQSPEDAFYSRLHAFCERFAGRNFVIGVSLFFQKLSKHIEQAFRQATEACEFRFYAPSEILYRYDQNLAMQPFLLGHIRLPLKESRELLMEGNACQASELLVRDARIYIEEHHPYPSKFKEVLMFCFWRILSDMSHAIGKEDAQKLMMHIDQTISNSSTMRELECAMRNICEQFCTVLQAQRKSVTDQAMDAAAEILRAEYAREWTLDELADRLHFNPSYFSTLFKQHFGMGYSDFLNEIRIEQAAQILRKRRVRVGELAQMVGYQNPTYFIKLFRKKYGVTPNEYKRGGAGGSAPEKSKK